MSDDDCVHVCVVVCVYVFVCALLHESGGDEVAPR